MFLPALVALLLDLVFYTGFFAGDDAQYLITARTVFSAEPFPIDVASVRLGMTLPTALLATVAGGRIHFISAAFTLVHIALVVLAFHVGRLVHGKAEARIAAALIAICPFLYIFAGAILPDLINAAWLSLSLLLLLIALDRNARSFAAGAGAVLGIAYTVKETALVMILPALVLLLLDKPKRKLALHYAAGIATVFLLETLLLRLLAGEWILHLGVLFDGSTQAHLGELAAEQGRSPGERFYLTFGEMKYLGPLWIWIMLVSSIAYVKFAPRPWPILLHSVWAFAYLTWGTTSVTSYSPPPIQSRYLAIVMVPAAVVAAHVLVRAGSRVPPRLRAPLLIALLSALMVGEVNRNLKRAGDIYFAYAARGVEEAYQRTSRDHPSLPILLAPGFSYSQSALPTAPRLLQLQSWDPWLVPPFVLIELAERYDEALVRRLLPNHPHATISTLDIVYPRQRLSRLYDGLASFWLVGPRPAPGAWHWPESETLVLLIDERPHADHMLPLFGGTPIRLLRVPAGHVVDWPGGELDRQFDMQFFDFNPPRMAPTFPRSVLPEGTDELEVELDLLPLSSRARVAGQLHYYGKSGKHLGTTKMEVDGPSLKLLAAANESIARWKLTLVLHPQEERGGRIQIGWPRVTARN